MIYKNVFAILDRPRKKSQQLLELPSKPNWNYEKAYENDNL